MARRQSSPNTGDRRIQPVRGRPFAGLRRAVSWHRRKLAVLAAVIAVLAGVNAATPHPPPLVSVVTAAHPLAGGARLTAADLTVRRLPVDAIADEVVTDSGQLVGRTLVAPVTAGTQLTTLSVLSPKLVKTTPDSVIVALRLADATLVSMLSVGDRVDVIAAVADPTSGGGSATTVATGARLVTVPSPPGAAGPLSVGQESEPVVILVEVDAETAHGLAQAAASGPLSIALR